MQAGGQDRARIGRLMKAPSFLQWDAASQPPTKEGRWMAWLLLRRANSLRSPLHPASNLQSKFPLSFILRTVQMRLAPSGPHRLFTARHNFSGRGVIEKVKSLVGRRIPHSWSL